MLEQLLQSSSLSALLQTSAPPLPLIIIISVVVVRRQVISLSLSLSSSHLPCFFSSLFLQVTLTNRNNFSKRKWHWKIHLLAALSPLRHLVSVCGFAGADPARIHRCCVPTSSQNRERREHVCGDFRHPKTPLLLLLLSRGDSRQEDPGEKDYEAWNAKQPGFFRLLHFIISIAVVLFPRSRTFFTHFLSFFWLIFILSDSAKEKKNLLQLLLCNYTWTSKQ